MHFGIFKFTARQRYVLSIAFTVLNFVQVILGMLMTGGSIYIVVTVSPKFYSEKAEITFVFTVTGMFGTHVVITYLVGIKIGDKCYNLAHKKSTGRHLIVWTIGSFNTTLNIFIIALLTSKISQHIIQSLRHSLEKGMHSYLKDTTWKHVLDKWQFGMQCCGIDSYKDWTKVAWLDKYSVNLGSTLVQEMRTSKEHLHLPVLPWSCCRYSFPMQCFHDPLQQVNSRHLWSKQPTLVEDSINTAGCLHVLKQPVTTVMWYMMALSIVLIIFQIIIVMISRLLYTSCKNAIILGDPDGISPGWIFTKGMFSRKTDQTLSEILIDLGVPKEDIARYKVFESENLSDTSNRSVSKETTSKSGSTPKNVYSKLLSQSHAMSQRTGSQMENEIGSKEEIITEPTEPTSDADPISSADEDALMLK